MTPYNVPVLLLTGYLGSGKTTLLNRILSNNKGIRFAVIVNDIGEVNIDAALIQKGGVVDQQDESLVALQNGCICCTLKMDLVEQLHDLLLQKRFDYIVIEASGICEPAPIAQTICSYSTLVHPDFLKDGQPQLDCIVSIVDALRMQDEFNGGAGLVNKQIAEDDIENLIIQQIEFCNLVLINKVDEVRSQELEKTKQIIRALQPKAEIITCNYGDVAFEHILHTHLFDFEKVATSATWIDAIEHHHEEEKPVLGHHHEHKGECHYGHSHGEEYGIGTFVYYRREPFDLGRFDHFVAKLWPKSVIRTKGICYFQGEEENCYVFEQAGRQVQLKQAGQWYATMPEEELQQILAKDQGLKQDWNEQYGDRMQKIVFIGQNMDREAISSLLDDCLVNIAVR